MATILTKLRVLQPELKKRHAIRDMGGFRLVRARSAARGLRAGRSRRWDDPDLAGLQLEISDALGLKVDLAMKDALKPRIEKRILAEVVML